jgi:hypothetical protein
MKEVAEFHEFTWDMIRALPKAYHHHANGDKVKVYCKPGLGELYYFADEVVEVDRFDAYNDSVSYTKLAPDYTKEGWTPPPLKEKYGKYIQFNKPVVVIQNKYSLEWLEGTFNYYPTEVLGELFGYLKEKYDIVYIRPKGDDKRYYKDENEIQEFDDFEYINNLHPYVYTIDKFLKLYPQFSFNVMQLMLEASSDKHITVSGGNACLSAYFGGDVIIYDSPEGRGAGRGVWGTDSWLSKLSGANIIGMNSHQDIINKVKEIW